MKKLIIISFVLALLMSAVAVAQYGTQQQDNSKSSMSTKTVSITGKISDDGKMFVSDKDSKSWTISNPDAVKGHGRAPRHAASPGGRRQKPSSCCVAQNGEE
jgi:hypothetical protein